MRTEVKYFNFPIQLLDGFMSNSRNCLNDIFDYAIYRHSDQVLVEGTIQDAYKSSCKFFGVTVGDESKSKKNGKILVDSIDRGSPMVGLNLSIFWDYYKNEKSEFDKACLLGFLAIKSILQDKAYCKIDNKYWLSRMAGLRSSCKSLEELPHEIKKFANEYQTKKIKNTLCHSWGLISYSRYTRGFYVSFKLHLDALVYEAEKRRKANKDKELKTRTDEAIRKANLRLNTLTTD